MVASITISHVAARMRSVSFFRTAIAVAAARTAAPNAFRRRGRTTISSPATRGEALHENALLTLAPDHRDRLRADREAYPHAERPAPARGGVHQDLLVAAHVAQAPQGVKRRQPLHQETRALRVGPLAGQRPGLVRGRVHRRGVRAEAYHRHAGVARRVRRHDRAGRQVVAGGADGLHHAAQLETGHERRRGRGLVQPEHGEDVREVQADGSNLHAHLAGSGGARPRPAVTRRGRRSWSPSTSFSGWASRSTWRATSRARRPEGTRGRVRPRDDRGSALGDADSRADRRRDRRGWTREGVAKDADAGGIGARVVSRRPRFRTSEKELVLTEPVARTRARVARDARYTPYLP